MHSGLNIIDISNPMEMELIDHLDLCGIAVRMTGGCILTAGGEHDLVSKLRILDYKNFIDPIQVGSLNLPGREQTVCAESNVIYVLSNSVYTNQSQIFIFLLDEETLKLEPLSNIKIKGTCHNLEIYQSILMASQKNQILLWDKTNPTEPEMLESFRIDNSWSFEYYNDYVEEEKEVTGSFVYMDAEWPFGSFFNSFNNPFNPFSSFYPWSSPPLIFPQPGSNWDGDFYQSRNNGPNSYSFTYNNWQINSYPQGLQGPFGNFSESAPWDVLPLFDLFTESFNTSLENIEFLFPE